MKRKKSVKIDLPVAVAIARDADTDDLVDGPGIRQDVQLARGVATQR